MSFFSKGTTQDSATVAPDLVRVKIFGPPGSMPIQEILFKDDENFEYDNYSVEGMDASGKLISIIGLGGQFFAILDDVG